MAALYTYQPLPPGRYIRLLKVRPAPENATKEATSHRPSKAVKHLNSAERRLSISEVQTQPLERLPESSAHAEKSVEVPIHETAVDIKHSDAEMDSELSSIKSDVVRETESAEQRRSGASPRGSHGKKLDEAVNDGPPPDPADSDVGSSLDPSADCADSDDLPENRHLPTASPPPSKALPREDPLESDTSLESFELHIIQCPLDEAPAYQTLSYVWGDSNRSYHKLNIGGLDLGITRNLSAALPSVFQHCVDGYLWCDQVCINQDDSNERNSQVAMMSDIYSKASSVLIWLEVNKDHAWELCRWLERLDLRHKGYMWSELTSRLEDAYDEIEAYERQIVDCICRDLKRRNKFSTQGEDITVSHEWFGLTNAMTGLLNNIWFTRVWDVQEALLSEKVIALLGDQACSLQGLARFAQAAESVTILYESAHLVFRPADTTLGYRVLTFILDWHMKEPEAFVLTLHGFLSNLRTLSIRGRLKASDKRDMVYGLLALTNNEKPYDITPDYSLPWNMVYTLVARAIIASRRDLNILFTCDGANDESSPSQHRSARMKLYLPGYRTGVRSLSGKLVSQLFTEGKIIETVRSMSKHLFDSLVKWYESVLMLEEVYSPLRADFEDHEYCVAQSRRLQSLLDELSPTLTDTMAFRACFLWEYDITLRKVVPELTRDDAIRVTLDAFNVLAAPYRQPLLSRPSSEESSSEENFGHRYVSFEDRPGIRKFERDTVCEHDVSIYHPCSALDCDLTGHRLLFRGRVALEVSYLRTIGVTTSEKVILSGSNVQPGDVVAVVRGLSAPAVLRKTDSGFYQYVSICYHEDVTDGENLYDWPKEEDAPIILV